jgi:hypothetical protein
MAGPAADSSENRRDLNAVFQRLVCALGYDPVEARDEILQKLRRSRGGLPTMFHICGGAPARRWPSPDECAPPEDECAPPEGVTGPVLPAAWINRTMELILVGDRLDVHYGSIMGFARADTTFSVDWHIVEQIWPLPAAKAPASVTMPPVTEVETDVEIIRSLAKKRGWSEDKLHEMSTGQVMKLLGDDLKALEGDAYRERNRSTYRRAQGRLKG